MQWMCRDGMSQTPTAATRYNDGNPDERSSQLRIAKVEEGRIQQLVKSRFENLAPDIQAKLNTGA
jgi:hypothetical protein